jgi:U3 small nucleolar RNA-associated protein 20
VSLGLPSFKEMLRKFLNRIFKLFEQTQSSDSDFINSLFRCTSELIRTYAIYQDLSEIQIKTLVQIINTHIPKYAVQSNALQCLRSVIHRRFVCADLYDLIEQQVQEMMVFNITPSIRGICSSIFVQFLLDYPLENERIEEHLNFVLKNLACKRMEGRIQLLEILKTLIEKLPKNVVDLYCELLFFTLLLRAVNDEHTECRVKVLQVMRSLVFSKKISQSKVKTLLSTVLQMGTAEENKRELLQLAKLNALQLLAEGGAESSNKLKGPEICSILQSAYQDGIVSEVESLQ